MRPARHSCIATVVILGLLCTGVGSACGGWESSAKARMACCAGAHHQGTSAEADGCCAAGEQRQHSEASGASPAPAPPVTTFAALHVVAPVMLHPQSAPPNARPTSADVRLLFSILLI
jgi:hypothetical protein